MLYQRLHSTTTSLRKVLRYIRLYGPGKTFFKVVGRSRPRRWLVAPRGSGCGRDIGVIGCGQFGFATIGYAIWKRFGNRFVDAYDIAPTAQSTFCWFFGIDSPASSAASLIANPAVRYVYVASNHASHAEYAIQALSAGKAVYVEKPIAVTRADLGRLCYCAARADALVFAGYNRPFSRAVRDLRPHIGRREKPITLTCVVSGHVIPPDHWYRNPEEGTRVCGNIGHWLDLAVHVLSWGVLPNDLTIHIAYSDLTATDDNLSISLTSTFGDLVVIVLTSRCEPFEGINETINFQCGDVIAKIDDFRKMRIWKAEKVFSYRYWPKDVGHNVALLQPFSSAKRDWQEVVNSSILMLAVTEMVKCGIRKRDFRFSDEHSDLARCIGDACAP